MRPGYREQEGDLAVALQPNPFSFACPTHFVDPMRLPRMQLFELEDQPWFPHLLRCGLTDYLAAMTERTRPYAAVLPSLVATLRHAQDPLIRDFCSGGGGPWPALMAGLVEAVPHARLELTDAYPNPAAVARFPQMRGVSYRDSPLEACAAWPADASLATLFSAFHHFAPTQAVEILRQASVTQTPIAVFEVTHRSLKALAAMCVVPIAVMLLTPMIRPLRWWRLIFTYLVPVLPIAAWWDGVVSCWRTYHPDELLDLAARAAPSGMTWRAGEWSTPGQPLPVTYLIGTPTSARGSG
jgi:hypothetical protein